MPAASAVEPELAPSHGAARRNTSWASAAVRVSRMPPRAAVITLADLNRCAESSAPMEKNRPPIDQEESTAREATRNGWRMPAGTPGRCGVSRKAERSRTGSGIQYAPASAALNSTSSVT
jgi:hypothetical protein